ncbi:MAG: hypothetical protein PHX30_05690 [Candidatus Pacebacteria bacterium]|jgi:hypothetical protein|nr:hypothetical protein [Candidatus Paceibacterota bacterium]
MHKAAIGKDIFDREVSMCKKLNRKNDGGCNWGKCQSCGVIPMLYKLHKSELLEKSEEIEEIKANIFLDKYHR